MSAPKDGGPAFASAGLDWHQDGMSLRDYFAASVLGAVVTATSTGQHHPTGVDARGEADTSKIAAAMACDAYALADAMLAARAKPGAA